jgi:uncharacterized protein (TIGR02145 family)
MASSSGGASSSGAHCQTAGNCGTFTDTRDGQVYKWTKIGTQTWMAQNVNFIPGVNTGGYSMCYNYDPANCTTYGRLYGFDAVGWACPVGWHVPTHAEWTTLEETLGGISFAGAKLKSVSGWSLNTGTDEYGFSALPGGYYDDYDDSFKGQLDYGQWWTATRNWNTFPYGRIMDASKATVGYLSANNKAYSVRCLKDTP